jgi:hypothetical protein
MLKRLAIVIVYLIVFCIGIAFLPIQVIILPFYYVITGKLYTNDIVTLSFDILDNFFNQWEDRQIMEKLFVFTHNKTGKTAIVRAENESKAWELLEKELIIIDGYILQADQG